MDAALGWIGDLVRYCARLVPRLQLVRITERAVKFRWGKAVEVGPGLHWWWPVTTEMDIVPVVRQVLSLSEQTIQTSEGKTVVADAIIVYSITDLYTFLVENHDADANVAELAAAGVRKAILSTPLAEVVGGRAKFDNRLTSEAQKSLKGFGVEVEALRLQSFAEGHVLIHAGAMFNVALNTASEVV